MTKLISNKSLLLLAVPLLLLGCRREESQIQTYRIAKDTTPAPAMESTSSMAAGSSLPAGHPNISGGSMAPAADNSAAPLTWKTPEGWTEVPPSELRVASFKVNKDGKMADISVIPLAGMAGSDEANVNRWRGQVGLPDATADALQKAAEPVQIGGQAAQLYDVAGQNPASGDSTRIIAVIQHRDGAEWFFKMIGDADLVESQKSAFIEFLKSVKFTGATAQAEMPATLPAGHPQIGDMSSAAQSSAPISHEGQPNWQVPSDWKEISGGQFLIAKFLINNGAATVNVSSSAGDGGGWAANVNRWRGQLGLQSAGDVAATPIDVAGGKGQLVELSGTNMQSSQPAQLVAVMVSQGDQTWFYKLMGDAKAVAGQRDAFIKFVQSAKY